MRTIAFDTETYPFYKTGKATKDIVPRLVCMSWSDGTTTELLERAKAVPLFVSWLRDPDGVVLVGLNLAFDLAVMIRAINEEYPQDSEELGRIIFAVKKWDIGIETKLLDISLGGMYLRGRYNLAALTNRWLGEELGGKKREGLGPDVWRNRYNELEGMDAKDYPTAAYHYALRDADVTWRIFAKLQTVPNPNRGGTAIRSQYAFDMHLMSAWGLMVDEPWIHAIKAHYETEAARYRQVLETAEVVMPDGTTQAFIQNGTMKRVVIQEVVRRAWASVGEPPQLTPSGGIQTDAKVIKDLESKGVDEPLFQAYTRHNRAVKFLSTYVEPLLDAGPGPICTRYDETKDSGRSSASGPNVQNFPSRKNKQDKTALKTWEMIQEQEADVEEGEAIERLLAGFVTGPDLRGAFIPRPGCVFVAADYTAIEMAGLAQVCRNLTGEMGTLALAINERLDLHLYVAAKLLGISYQECRERYDAKDTEVADWRQISKIANYGFAGGASARTFIEYAAGFDMKVDLSLAEKVKEAWLAAWSEMLPYFQYISSCETARGTFHVEQHGPNRKTTGWRLRVTSRYTAAANTLFQGIVADGALYSLHMIVKACYVEDDSPLYGCRPLLFVHDEIVIEAPAERAEAASVELSRLMVAGMKVFLPDLLVEADPKILPERWGK